MGRSRWGSERPIGHGGDRLERDEDPIEVGVAVLLAADERRKELVATAATVGLGDDDGEVVVGEEEFGGFVSFEGKWKHDKNMNLFEEKLVF